MVSYRAQLDELRMRHPHNCHGYFISYDADRKMGKVTRLSGRPTEASRSKPELIGQVYKHPVEEGKFCAAPSLSCISMRLTPQDFQSELNKAYDTHRDALDYLKLQHMHALCQLVPEKRERHA